VPNKNVRLFCGLPLVAWGVIQSECSHLVDRTYLSTDSERIADIGREHGAKIIWRDYEQHEDNSGNIPFLHAVSKIREMHNDFDTMVGMLPTSPLLRPGDVDGAIKVFRENNSQAVLAAARMEEVTIYKKEGDRIEIAVASKKDEYLSLNGTGLAVWTPERYTATNPQLTDKEVDDNIMAHFQKQYPDFGDVHFYVVEPWQDWDIDTESDFQFVELLMEHFILRGRGPEVYYEYKGEI